MGGEKAIIDWSAWDAFEWDDLDQCCRCGFAVSCACPEDPE